MPCLQFPVLQTARRVSSVRNPLDFVRSIVRSRLLDHTNPKRQRGNALQPSLTLRVTISGDRVKYRLHRSVCSVLSCLFIRKVTLCMIV